MKTVIRIATSACIIILIATLILRHEQNTRQLTISNEALNRQLAETDLLRAETNRLANLLGKASEDSKTERDELLSLRAQISKLRTLEQENASFKAERASHSALQTPTLGTPAVSQPATGSETKAIQPPANMTDFGEVELVDGVQTRLDLGAGHGCVITPTVLSNGNFLLRIAVEASTPAGDTEQLGRSQVISPPGRGAAIFVGGRMIAVTPKLKTP